MADAAPESFSNVEVTAKANVYFDGKVVSHTVRLADGSKKTLGLIYPGSFHFGTGQPELMQIIAGSCRVRIDGQSDFSNYAAGATFRVPGNSGFDIAVESGIAEYICTFE
jgi:purine/pyrimidine-nucleoside phosphorylase